MKHPTRRGRVAPEGVVQPMSAYALRAASERLVADVATDTAHERDSQHLKRLMALDERRGELMRQLEAVDGSLAAARAVLLGAGPRDEQHATSAA
ncbi:MAG: hypothetical protein ACLGIS_16775 [Actinomycetes bacterium]